MPLQRFQRKPGINVELSPSLNSEGWSSGNLIRWRNGLPQALLGFIAYCSGIVNGVARALHYWSDLTANEWLAVGSNSKLYLVYSGALIDITPSSGFTPGSVSDGGTPFALLIWSLDNFGQDLIAVPSGQGVFTWTPPTPSPASLILSAGTLIGGAVAASLAPWNSISNGGFTITINGQQTVVQGLNFQAATSPTAIANTIQAALGAAATVSVVTEATGDWQFTIQSAFDSDGSLSYATPPPAGIQDISTLIGWTSATASSLTNGNGPPAQNNGALVLDQIQIILAWGCTPIGATSADPMLLRWCSASDYTDWIASVTNTAGSYRIPHGSRIIGGLQVPGMALIWTDIGLWVVTYIGFPLVFSINPIGANCGLIGQKAAEVLGQTVYWMSDHGFFNLTGSGPQQMPCPVWDIVFNNLDDPNQNKCACGTNYHYSEVWWFYPSKSGGSGEIDSYVKVNIQEGEWDYGAATLDSPNIYARTASTDQNAPGPPISVDLNGVLQQADQGYTQGANGPAMPATITSGYGAIAEGDQQMIVKKLLPDFLWEGDNPSLELTALFRAFPGDQPTSVGPFTVTPSTEYITLSSPQTVTIGGVEVTANVFPRGREMALQIANISGWWRLGNLRIDAAPAGKI